jgi:hypothetical protein
MISTKRVFSNNSNINYSNYNQNKNGVEILKNIKQKNNIDQQNNTNKLNDNLNKFGSYNEYITLSKSYYKYVYDGKCSKNATTNLYNSNISYKDIDYFNNNFCKNNILYPYGAYNADNELNMQFPYRLDLNKWCKSKQNCEGNQKYENENVCYKENICYKNTCKSRLCKNPKPLFI